MSWRDEAVRSVAVTAAAALLAAGCSGVRRAATAGPSAGASCDVASLAGVAVGGARVVAASRVQAGGFVPPGGTRPLEGLPAFCRVEAVATPVPGSEIHFEVWIPDAAAWNGKLVATGNGGYSPALAYADMAGVLRRGYAAVGGDTGHQTADPNDLRFVIGHPERLTDWGSRSIHAITGPAKRLVAAVRGRAPARAYFSGCSTGGHQAYAELQRYPDDFDGVIAGAPGNNRVRLNVGFLWQFLANRERGNDARPILTPAKVALVTRAVVAACDARDGVADGVVDDPRACAFDPAVLACRAAGAPGCLTAAELAALRRMYAGARNARTGAQLYPGWPVGSEAGWPAYWGRDEPARADFWRHWVFGDPRWNWWTFDFDRDVARADAAVGRVVDQVSPDLAAFRRRGGKAIVYQGWQDPVVNAYDTIDYYERVRAGLGGDSAAAQAAADAFFRLFMVPGMGHCAGGPGATTFGNPGPPPPVVDAAHDVLAALDAWVERGQAPERIVAARLEGGRLVRTRPLCPYPRRAVYRPGSSPDRAASFACR